MAEAAPILILGAGASGLMAAVAASRVRPRAVLLLEKEARAGRKLMATGNGRCNLLNLRVPRGAYAGSGAQVAHALLETTPPARLLEMFAAIGLTTREEAEGRAYPFSGQAGAVVDVLRAACARQGVRIQTDTAVQAITPQGRGFLVKTCGGEVLRAARVIIAGGGKASPSLGSDGSAHALLAALGHPVSPLYPAIVPLRVPPEHIRGLKGVRTPASLYLWVEGRRVQEEAGEVLFGDGSVSGIAAMQLARRVQVALADKREVVLSIRLMEPAAARAEIDGRAALFAGEPAERLFTGLLHSRLGLCLLRAAGLSPQTPVTRAAVAPLAALLSDWRLPVLGTLPFEAAQVTAGGATLDAFDPQTLASRLVPGLYACGEVLDVDGPCGGYNLLWAWASGLAAGRAAAHDISL